MAMNPCRGLRRSSAALVVVPARLAARPPRTVVLCATVFRDGLGLAICRTIALAHGGEIGARSHPAGCAVFEVLLPSAGPTHAEPPRSPALGRTVPAAVQMP